MPQPTVGSALTEEEIALLKAAYGGDLPKVELLVRQGVNVNVQSNEFYDMGAHQKVTPLMCAAGRGHLEVVRWLLGHRANHAAETTLTPSEGGPGTQALHFAAAGGHEAVVAALLDAGANANAQGKRGRTPLTWTLEEGKLGCAKLLLARGALAGVKSKHKGFEPPLLVLAKGAANTTSLVARQGKLVPAGKDFWDQKEALLEMWESLLAAGADPRGKDSSGETALHTLARRMPDDIRLPMARRLLAKGADADAVDKFGNSPLLRAALSKSLEFARLLLEYPVDVNRLCPRGSIVDVVEGNIATARKDMKEARTEAIRKEYEGELRELEVFLELLKSRGGKRKSELAVAVEKEVPEVRHIATDFLKLINSGEAEWALLAVKAPFEAVSEAYMKYAKGKGRQEKVPIRAAANLEEIPPMAAVIKVKGSPWTIVLRTIFYVRAADFKHVDGAAKELSKTLKTRAVSYGGTEETDNGECELFEGGKSVAKAGDGKSIALLTREGVPLPACYPAREGDKTWLSVEKGSVGMVERADLIGR